MKLKKKRGSWRRAEVTTLGSWLSRGGWRAITTSDQGTLHLSICFVLMMRKISHIIVELALMNHRIAQYTSIHEICRYIFPMGMASSSLSVCWLIKISFCFQLQLHPWLILTTSPPSHPRFTSRMPHVGRTTRRPRVRGPREWAHLFGMCTLYFIKPRGVERWTSQARLADDALLHLAYCNLGIFVK